MYFGLRLLGLLALLLPGYGFAGTEASAAVVQQLDLTKSWAGYFSLLVMVLAYIAAMFEEATELRKSKPMLLAAALVWFFIVLVYQEQAMQIAQALAGYSLGEGDLLRRAMGKKKKEIIY